MNIYPSPFPISIAEFSAYLLREVPEQALRRIGEGLTEGRSWTLSVKSTLETFGSQHQFRSIYTDTKASMKEFLLDFIWWKDGPTGGAILACECEWGYSGGVGAVGEDFDKLLSFKAPMKLMIFSSGNSPSAQARCLAEMNRYLKEYPSHIKDEQYLVIDFCEQARTWSATIKSDGLDGSLELCAMGE